MNFPKRGEEKESIKMKVDWFLLSEGIGMISTNYHKTKQKYNFDNMTEHSLTNITMTIIEFEYLYKNEYCII